MSVENKIDDRYEELVYVKRGKLWSMLRKRSLFIIMESDPNKGHRISYLSPEEEIISEYKFGGRTAVAA